MRIGILRFLRWRGMDPGDAIIAVNEGRVFANGKRLDVDDDVSFTDEVCVEEPIFRNVSRKEKTR